LQIESTTTSELGASVTVTPIPNDAGVIVDQALVDAAISKSSDAATLTRSLGYKQVHTITLTQSTVPFKARVIVQDKANLSLGATYIISSIGRYPNTIEKPVKVAGIYWAPVNAGATELATSYSAGTAAQMTTARVGYYFQWGRTNAPFENTCTHATYAGPVSAAEAAGTYANTFITINEEPFDWLTPQDDGLWSDENAQGPCPDGWRVPTAAEFATAFSNTTELAAANYVENKIVANKVLVVSGDDTETLLYIPAAGTISGINAGSLGLGDISAYYSSTCTGIMVKILYGYTNTTISADASDHRRTAMNIRCVLDGVQEVGE
jgi:uncharacterized protein (TIGR02145 family)